MSTFQSRAQTMMLTSTVSVMMLLIPSLAYSRFTLSKIMPASSNAPSPRSEHLAVVISSGDGPLLVIHGGRDHNGPKSDTWTYLLSKNQWTLLTPRTVAATHRPPPTYGAIGGYRFVEGKSSPFLYVAFGITKGGLINHQMWAMDFEDFTWNLIEATGDIPDGRYGAIGSLERFIRPDGTVESAMIFSHGLGVDGLLSDTYRCSFHKTNPYQVSWKVLRSSVSQYSTLQPHPMWRQASAYTANRDLVAFGGCYASHETGGRCPHSDVWLLEYKQASDIAKEDDSFVNKTSILPEEVRSVQWRKAPSEPGPRLGASMSQGLSSFEGAYENPLSTVVLYSGSHFAENTSGSPFLLSPKIDGDEVSIFSTQSLAWIRERVQFLGPPDEQRSVFSSKRGMSMNVVRFRDDGLDTSEEFYLLFGGQHENNSFSPFLLKMSFDAFMQSDILDTKSRYISRPFAHGLAMFLSWGVTMWIGVGSLRYGGSQERRRRSVVLHICCELLSLALLWVGIGVLRKGRHSSNPSFLHARLGTGLVTLAMFQVLIASIKVCVGWIKRSDFGERHLGRRVTWVHVLQNLLTVTHSALGVLLLLLGWWNITLGLFLILSPTILWLHWIVMCACLVMITVIMELGRERKTFKHRDSSPHVDTGGVGHGSTRERMGATNWPR